MMYLLYRVRDSIDGKRRVIQCFDEFHAYLDDPVIEREVKRGIKLTVRKTLSMCLPRRSRTMRCPAVLAARSCRRPSQKSACAIRKLSERIMPSLLMLNTTR